jgi:hypothetical protein
LSPFPYFFFFHHTCSLYVFDTSYFVIMFHCHFSGTQELWTVV